MHSKPFQTLIILAVVMLLNACGGPRLNRKTQQLIDYGPMLTVKDPHIEVNLDQILIRNSRGSWAKDANWDEYLLVIKKADKEADMMIENVLIEDIMGGFHSPESTRKSLNKSSKHVKKKYKKAGYKVKLGAGSTHATALGISMAVGGGVTAGAVTATGAIGNLTSVGVGAAVAVPALLVAGVTKVVFNTRVNNRIQQRQTLLPFKLIEENNELDLLFPAVPLPQKLVVHYSHKGESRQINLDLTLVTSDLHIKNR